MKNYLIQNNIIVKKSLIHGYGVFATSPIQPQEIIEECHTLFMPKVPALTNYLFNANLESNSGLPLGFGAIYNHSDHPNATYEIDLNTNLTTFTALRFIQAGEEICISYGKGWFSSRNAKVIEIPWWKKSWRYFRGMPFRALLIIGLIYTIIYALRSFPQLPH